MHRFVIEYPSNPVSKVQFGSDTSSLPSQRMASFYQRPSILVVDDNPVNLRFIQAILGEFQADLLLATSAQEALGVISSKKLALALLDVCMPDVNGFELASQLRAQANAVPIIFVTALHPTTESTALAYSVGGADFLYKPLDPIILRAKVAVFLDIYRIHEAEESKVRELELLHHTVVQSRVEAENMAAELALQKERFQLVVEASPSALIMVTADGQITLVNTQTETLFGYQRHEVLGHALEMLLPERFRAPHGHLLNAFFAHPATHKKGADRSLFGLHKDGREIPVDISLNPIDTSEGKFVLASIIDVTTRKRAEDQLKAFAQRLSLATQVLQAGIWDWDIRTNTIVWDDRMCEIYGASSSTQIGYDEWASSVVPQDLPAAEAIMNSVIISKSQCSYDFRITLPDGSLRYIHAAAGAVLDEAGRVTRVVGVNLDTTEHKLVEHLEHTLTAQLKAVNEELEKFAYVASHDLKAPLRVIDNASKWLEEDLQAHFTDDTRESMDLLRGRVKRMETLLDDLLEYARIGRTTDARYTETIAGDVLTDNILKLLPLDGFAVTISAVFARIQVCRMPLQQILMNLINNAAKHHDMKKGCIEVTVEDHGTAYEFAVKDDGPGIPKQFHGQVFKMFQTLKPRDQVEGSGMGLAMVRKTIDLFGGTVQLESEGRGCTFRFTWPKQQHFIA